MIKTKHKPYWIKKTRLFKEDRYICSECDYVSDKPYKICPKCGSEINKIIDDGGWVEDAELYELL